MLTFIIIVHNRISSKNKTKKFQKKKEQSYYSGH